MDKFDFTNLEVGQKVAVDTGYTLQYCEILHVDGMLVTVETPSHVFRSFARPDVYAIPAELDRLERDTDCHIGAREYQVAQLKLEGKL